MTHLSVRPPRQNNARGDMMSKLLRYCLILGAIGFFTFLWCYFFGTNFKDVFIGSVACFCLADYVDRTS